MVALLSHVHEAVLQIAQHRFKTVVRRGQEHSMHVELQRAYNYKVHRQCIVLSQRVGFHSPQSLAVEGLARKPGVFDTD
jgi:hypothetical protein